MSAEWPLQAGTSWKLTLPCTRAEAEALTALEEPLPGFDPPPVLMTSEPDPAEPERWQLDAYCEGAPDDALIAAIRALVPDAAWHAVETIADEDWVTRSQAFLEPIRAGRFLVHTAAHAGEVAPATVPFLIEAGRAFGTGHHETTRGCLETLDALAAGGASFRRIADIGTGTGLLAFAARHLWPDAAVLAADIDPVAIEVTRANMAANGVPAEAVALAAAPGFDAPAIRAAAPFDLVLANILAGPLVALAPDFAEATAPGGSIVLAGLLATQEDALIAAFAAAGFARADARAIGEWPVLHLVRRDTEGA